MTENFFGAQTTNVLANFTRWMGGIFFALTLILSVLYAKQSNQKSAIREKLLQAPKPPAAPAAVPKTAPDAKSASPDSTAAPVKVKSAPTPEPPKTGDAEQAPEGSKPEAPPKPADQKSGATEPPQAPK
jgi:preprotein translocase subunit SecG